MISIQQRIGIMENRMKISGLRGYEFIITLNMRDYRELVESMNCEGGMIEKYKGMAVQYGEFTSIGIKI